MITTIASAVRSLFAPRRRAPGRHRTGIPALELLAHLGATTTAVSAPTGWHVPRTAGWAPRVRYTASLDPVTQLIPAVA